MEESMEAYRDLNFSYCLRFLFLALDLLQPNVLCNKLGFSTLGLRIGVLCLHLLFLSIIFCFLKNKNPLS